MTCLSNFEYLTEIQCTHKKENGKTKIYTDFDSDILSQDLHLAMNLRLLSLTFSNKEKEGNGEEESSGKVGRARREGGEGGRF